METGWRWAALGIGMLIAALGLAAEHWAPWKLSLIGRYVAGTLALYAGLATWRLLLGDWETPMGYTAIVVAGGLTVMGAYRVDRLVKRVRQAERAEAADDELAG